LARSEGVQFLLVEADHFGYSAGEMIRGAEWLMLTIRWVYTKTRIRRYPNRSRIYDVESFGR
jgi:hypothetical protein